VIELGPQRDSGRHDLRAVHERDRDAAPGAIRAALRVLAWLPPLARHLRQGRNPTFDKHAALTQSVLRSNLPTSSFSLSVPKARGGPAHFNKRNVEDRNRSELALLGIATPGNSGALAGVEPQQRVRGV